MIYFTFSELPTYYMDGGSQLSFWRQFQLYTPSLNIQGKSLEQVLVVEHKGSVNTSVAPTKCSLLEQKGCRLF